MVEEASSPPLLAYGVSKRRVKRLRALVVTVVIVSVVALQFNWHRPVVEFGQRHYHAWRLPHAMRSAKDAAAANDRAAMTAAWWRMHEHRRGSLRGTGKGWKYAPPDVGNILFIADRSSINAGEELCVGLAENGMNGMPYLFFETWRTSPSGERDIAMRWDVHIAPKEIVPRLKFVACRANPNRPNEAHVDFVTDNRPGTLVVDLVPGNTAKVSGDGWSHFGYDWWCPGNGEMKLQVAPAAAREVKVGRDFAAIAVPDNEHIEVARAAPNEVFIFSIKGNEPPTTRMALTVLGGAEGAVYAKPDPPPAPEPVAVLARFGDSDFAYKATEAHRRVFRTTPDGRLAAIDGHSYAYVWTNALPGVAYRFPYGTRGSLGQASVALSPDGTTLAVIAPQWSTALMWDLRSLSGIAPPATQPARPK